MPAIVILLKTFFASFGVMDPVGNVPTFLSLTEKMDEAGRRRTARDAVLRAGGMLLFFVFLGGAVLEVFHISIGSFRVAGGIVLMLLGLEILYGFRLGRGKEETEGDVALVPLATPLIAGPGMITTAVILAKEYGYAATLAGIALNLGLSYVLFLHSGLLLKIFGRKGSLIFAKLMGLILVAMGVEFIRNGLS
jgi:multiple antibiotic resistance protein